MPFHLFTRKKNGPFGMTVSGDLGAFSGVNELCDLIIRGTRHFFPIPSNLCRFF
jgi:hypothetical protein